MTQTNPALEAAIREAPLDAAPYAVYADWLEAQGSPAGEWSALERTERDPDRRAVLAQQLGLPPPELATWGTRHGFFSWLRLENARDWTDALFDPVELATQLFKSPLAAGLEMLRIGMLRWDHNHTDVPAVLDVAGQYGWATALDLLHLGDIDSHIDMAHHVIGEVGPVISRAFPRLRELHLKSGEQTWRGGGETFGVAGLALPALETLVIETCAMTSARLADLFAGELPRVRELELWFGSRDYDSDATVADLAPLLTGDRFAAVTDLGLRNHELGSELIEVLARSPIAPRLRSLDLSMSTLDDVDARALAAAAARFPMLETLDVDDNFLTSDGL
ncbi:MAG TPA: TIGR02996 domain-containing protein, partial [Kofleriaceae bacterium]|nr:TIGR02996 domain-containing protein [Kofleriaceae bacterium]